MITKINNSLFNRNNNDKAIEIKSEGSLKKIIFVLDATNSLIQDNEKTYNQKILELFK